MAFRDRLIIEWNKTQQNQTYADQKRVYYLSLEFLMGRALDNAMLNVGMKDVARGMRLKSDTRAYTDYSMQRVSETLAFVWRTSLTRRGKLPVSRYRLSCNDGDSSM